MKPAQFFRIGLMSLALAQPLVAKEASPTLDPILATLVEDTGSAERIESAEYLRVYSQEIAASACYLYNEIDTELSLALLKEARDGFDLHIDALLNGNVSLGIIGGEERRKTIAELQDIQAVWAPIAAATDALMADPSDSDAVRVIKATNLDLFEKTDRLVSNLEGQYSNPTELLQSDVLTLEIVGRQAMMSQKIAKFACQIFTGGSSVEISNGLENAIQIYEASLNALLHGMPSLGIMAAPTPDIKASLTRVMADWSDVQPYVGALLAGETISLDQQIELFRHMAKEMHALEDIAHAYVLYSKH